MAERAFNTRYVLDAALSDCQNYNCHGCDHQKFRLFLGHHTVRSDDANTVRLVADDGTDINVSAQIFVYSAGAGLQDLVKGLHDISLPLRRFKTPLMIADPIAGANIISLSDREITMMNHGSFSVVGLTKDNVSVGAKYEHDLLKERTELLRSVAKKSFGESLIVRDEYCCTKVDFGGNDEFPDLGAQWKEVMNNHFCVVPGKFSESPFIADKLGTEIWNRVNNSPVALRPGDKPQDVVNKHEQLSSSHPGYENAVLETRQ